MSKTKPIEVKKSNISSENSSKCSYKIKDKEGLSKDEFIEALDKYSSLNVDITDVVQEEKHDPEQVYHKFVDWMKINYEKEDPDLIIRTLEDVHAFC